MGEKVLIVGPPGTGKTTFMARTVKKLIDDWCRESGCPAFQCDDILIATLTRGAAAEAASRDIVLAEGQIATLHAHCFRLLGCPKLMVDKDAIGGFNDRVCTKGKPWLCLSPDEETHLLQSYLLRRSRMDKSEVPEYKVDSKGRKQVNETWDFMQEYEAYKRLENYKDFHDCIEQCLVEEIFPEPMPSYIFVDEAQDNDKLESRLVNLWATAAKRTYVIGDPDQNLYEFRGSDSDNMLHATFDSRRVLSRSYRVPSEVHRVAVRVRERIGDKFDVSYEPRDETGSAGVLDMGFLGRRLTGGNDADEIVDHARHNHLAHGRRVMFIAPGDFAVQRIITALRRANIIYHNPFSRKNGSWNPYTPAKGLSTLKRASMLLDPIMEHERLWTYEELDAWVSWCQAKVFKAGTKARIKKLGSQKSSKATVIEYDDLVDLFKDFDEFDELVRSDKVLSWWWRYVLKDHRKKVENVQGLFAAGGLDKLKGEPEAIVGTIHSVKGGECDTVYVSNELGKKFYDVLRYGEEDQIHRMMYVAVTRARHSVVLCDGSNHMKEVYLWPI